MYPTALFAEPNTAVEMRILNLNAAAIEVFFTFAGVAIYVSDENIFRSEIEGPQATPYFHGAP
jgi:hypothetical protein